MHIRLTKRKFKLEGAR